MCADTYSNERTKQTVRNNEVSVLSGAVLYFYCQTLAQFYSHTLFLSKFKILGVALLSGNHLIQNSKKTKKKNTQEYFTSSFCFDCEPVAIVSEQLQLVVISPFSLYTLSFLS